MEVLYSPARTEYPASSWQKMMWLNFMQVWKPVYQGRVRILSELLSVTNSFMQVNV